MTLQSGAMARTALLSICVFVALCLAGVPQPSQAQPDAMYETVTEQARRLSLEPFREPDKAIPAELDGLGYNQYQNIRFRPETALWSETAALFRAQFFPVGFLFDKAVAINVVGGGQATALAASRDMFEWKDAGLRGAPPRQVPLAGFRLHYPLNGPLPADEVAAFLGASYFRLIGRDQVYGASARGIAIDTGLPKKEEFPSFRAFWLVQPDADVRDMRIYALLDSPGMAGAYRFVLRPGTRTSVEVSATLFVRHDISLVGIAPLTSMFFTGEASRRRELDYRPEVHDSDGLLIAAGNGEIIWRPLDNPAQLAITSFGTTSPRGFGLLQRDRVFDHYQDLQARYDRRPSFWVEPIGDWGEGEVRLIEIPSDREVHDNIVAFWVSRAPVKKGQRFEIAYRLSALADEARLSPGGYVVGTRLAPASASSETPASATARRVIVDFAGGELPLLRAEQPVQGEVSVTNGKLGPVRTERISEPAGWRLVFDVEPDGKKPVDLRAFLRLRDEVLTETWTQVLRP